MYFFKAPGKTCIARLLTIAVSIFFLFSVGFSTASAATTSVAKAVVAGSDDAEERSTGSVNLTSSDLELTTDGSYQQTVGMRFTGLAIPKNAIIQRAYIQFNVDEITSGATALTIRGELPTAGTAATFTTTRGSISARINPVSPTVSWAPLAWSTRHVAGPAQATPDLSSIVQAIVNLPNWQSGNAAAFIVTGTGVRTAGAFESGAQYAPILRVDYQTPGSISLNSWTELGVAFNGLELGVDTVSKRLFVPLGVGFQQPANYATTVTYKLGDQGYALGFAGQLPVASGVSQNFGSISYGSKIPVQLYNGGVIVDTYTLVFTDVPVVSLVAPTIVDEPKYPGTFSLASGQFSQNVAAGPMGIEFRGETSQQFDKKSFSIELREADPLVEREIKLLDLRKDGDWITDATYRDTTFVRNIISHDIFNAMRPFAHYTGGTGKGQPTIKGRPVEVILNERYHGAYILEEKVDRKLVNVAKINVPVDAAGVELWDQVDWTNPANQSAMYKADGNNASLYPSYSLAQTSTSSGDWEQEYPDIDDVARLGSAHRFHQFRQLLQDAEFVSQVGNLVDIDSVVDYWLLTNMTGNRDTLKKNYYLARSSTATGPGKWFIVPWDFDATFGMLWDGTPYPTTAWWDPAKNKLISRLSTLTATGFNAKAKLRWN